MTKRTLSLNFRPILPSWRFAVVVPKLLRLIAAARLKGKMMAGLNPWDYAAKTRKEHA
jgi:hypothetical protein